MVRHYKRKGARPWRDKDKRMAAAVRLRTEGKSLRAIAGELAVAPSTILEDLRKWERLHPNVVSVAFDRAVRTCPPGGETEQLDRTPDESAPKLRRVK